MKLNRRDFLFGTLGLASAPAMGGPVRSLLSPLGILEPVLAPPTALDYIQDGLVGMWDGIENAGWGVHDPSATTWVNLVNGGTFNVGSGNYFTDDSLYVATDKMASLAIPLYGIQDNNAYTFEIVGASYNGQSLCTIPYAYGAAFSAFPDWSDSDSYVIGCGGNMSIKNTGPRGTRKSFGLIVSGDTWKLFSKQFNAEKSGTWTKTTSRFDGGKLRSVSATNVLRLYSRALTPEEIRYNYLIDKMRFGL